MMSNFEEPQQNSGAVSALRSLLGNSDNIVVFTGAGISTESGIPDFRGPNGIWKSMTPIDFHDFVSSESVRRESWSRKFNGDRTMASALPNTGHQIISTLVDMGKVTAVITQNVDGLHQLSGTPDDIVIELHGNASYATCLDCGKRFELETIEGPFLAEGVIPYCDDCNGIIKTATISFGQPMPILKMQKAEYAAVACDLFIVLGSSLTVYPAAGLPQLAKQNGAKLIIVNEQLTDLDAMFDLKIQSAIGSTLAQAVA